MQDDDTGAEGGRSAHETNLNARFGALLTLADLASVLRYPSVRAVQMARTRGQLPVPTIFLATRRQWFATARHVAEFLSRLDAEAAPPINKNEGTPMS